MYSQHPEIARRWSNEMAGKKKGEDDAYVTYERGRTGGTVRGPASGMVSGANGPYKGESGDAVTQRKKSSVGTAIQQKKGQARPEIIRAAAKRLGGNVHHSPKGTMTPFPRKKGGKS
jgi:hypothetical protein